MPRVGRYPVQRSSMGIRREARGSGSPDARRGSDASAGPARGDRSANAIPGLRRGFIRHRRGPRRRWRPHGRALGEGSMSASDKTDATPLLWDTTAEPSAFDPEDWFRYCEEVNVRQPPRLPALGIQSVMPAHLDIAVQRYGAEVDDFTLADHPVATFAFAGVPVVLGVSAKGSYAAGGLEEMIAMGVRRVLFLGGGATLVAGMPVGLLFVSTQALRDDGVCVHLEPHRRH